MSDDPPVAVAAGSLRSSVRAEARGTFDTAYWSSGGITYRVEIPRALRAGAEVARVP